ncbi:sigma-70 family RNA polymerase sigma factor [Hoyosella rhizosphaerae]|nr:sigma-70 family RNA polymerase sigma factor [Hoyosella rhizosphaerae]
MHDLSALSDEVLARRAALGARPEFNEIVRRHGPALFRYAKRMLADQGDAEDAVQEAFVAAWKSLPDWEGRSALRTWLFTIVARKATDHLRKRRPTPAEITTDSAATDPHSNPEQKARYNNLLAALEQALTALPTGQRSVWLLREVEGLSYSEIGEVLAMSYDSVRGNLARARSTLGGALSEWR